ncbi:MAG TPA: hypothetical protein VGF18_04740, partial [Candidatus Tumulicola sp.]
MPLRADSKSRPAWRRCRSGLPAEEVLLLWKATASKSSDGCRCGLRRRPMLPRQPNNERAGDREYYRARFRATTELAIGNFLDQAAAALQELERVVDFGDDE